MKYPIGTVYSKALGKKKDTDTSSANTKGEHSSKSKRAATSRKQSYCDDPQLEPPITKCCCEPEVSNRDNPSDDLQATCLESTDSKDLVMEDLELRLRTNEIDIADLEEDISKQDKLLSSLQHEHGIQRLSRFDTKREINSGQSLWQSVKNKSLELIERRKALEEVRTKLRRQRLCALDIYHHNPTDLKEEVTVASDPSSSSLRVSASTDSNELYSSQSLELKTDRNLAEVKQPPKNSQGDAIKSCPQNTEWSLTEIAQNQEVQKVPTNGGVFQGRKVAPLANIEEYAFGLVSDNNPFRQPQYQIRLAGSSTSSKTTIWPTPKYSAISDAALTSTDPHPNNLKATDGSSSSHILIEHQSPKPHSVFNEGIIYTVHDDTDSGPENGETPSSSIDQPFSIWSEYSYEDDSDSESDGLSSNSTFMEDSTDEKHGKFQYSLSRSFLSGFATFALLVSYTMYSATLGFITHMPNGSTSTQSQQNITGSDTSPMGVRSRKKRKQTSQNDSNFPEDEEDGSVQGNGSRASPQESNQPKFACHYYKHKPEVHQTRSCSGPGWYRVRRVKEHLYRVHSLPLHCYRCQLTFESADANAELERHQRGGGLCELRASTLKEGLSKDQEIRLRSRRRTGQSEPEKWRDIYRILFPGVDDANIPSPYYEVASLSEEEYRRRTASITQEIPIRFHHHLESTGIVPFALLQNIQSELQVVINEVVESHQRDSRGSTEPTVPSQHREEVLDIADNSSGEMYPYTGWNRRYPLPGSFPLESTTSSQNGSGIFDPQLPSAYPMAGYNFGSLVYSNLSSTTGHQLFPLADNSRGTQPSSQSGTQDPRTADPPFMGQFEEMFPFR